MSSEFDVELTIWLPEDKTGVAAIAEALGAAHIPGRLVSRERDLIVARFPRVQASGIAALPEALRLAQASTSAALRAVMPGFAAAGGLRWRDIVEARVFAIASDPS